ncbi:hypothetical protein [Nocardia wallacei]|uniref:hypothetical protein n=1 Tax=Nocardia wallacei TaxID=480035 RepID=UPI002454C57D|nr:hypothetical protein [Nocardia wallacei]
MSTRQLRGTGEQSEDVAAELDSVAAERDRLAELLDEMTAAVAAVLYRDFGEHSSANDPWRNAIRALQGLES